MIAYDARRRLDDAHLRHIMEAFNDRFGNIVRTDADRVHRLITEEIPAKVATDAVYENSKEQGKISKARLDHDVALDQVMLSLLKDDDTGLAEQYVNNERFKRWLSNTEFWLTFNEGRWPNWLMHDVEDPTVGNEDPASGPFWRWGNPASPELPVIGQSQLRAGGTGAAYKPYPLTPELD